MPKFVQIIFKLQKEQKFMYQKYINNILESDC